MHRRRLGVDRARVRPDFWLEQAREDECDSRNTRGFPAGGIWLHLFAMVCVALPFSFRTERALFLRLLTLWWLWWWWWVAVQLSRPVTDRDLVLDAEGFDLLDEIGCFVIPLRSITEVRVAYGHTKHFSCFSRIG